MAKRKPLVSIEKDETENGFSMHVLHERLPNPQEWKKILRKENKFLTDFMLGKIKLEQGSKVTVLGLAPHAPTLVEALTQVELQFPDEMSPDELAKYKSYLQEFRKNLGV